MKSIHTLLDEDAVLRDGDYLIELERRCIWSKVHRDLPILRAWTGAAAGMIGAARAAWNALGHLPVAPAPVQSRKEERPQ